MVINIGESSSIASEFMQSYNLSFPVLLDAKGEVAKRYNIRGIPTTIFLNRGGVIQEIVVGAFPNKAQIEKGLVKIIP